MVALVLQKDEVFYLFGCIGVAERGSICIYMFGCIGVIIISERNLIKKIIIKMIIIKMSERGSRKTFFRVGFTC